MTPDLDLLRDLEDVEASLLSWGVVDGALSLEDVRAAAARCGYDGATANAALRALNDAGLLFAAKDRGAGYYRSRAGEAVRLLVRLRQLFQMPNPQSFGRAPALISDFRFLTRPRRFPRRDRPLSAVIEEISAADGIAPEEARALRTIVGDATLSSFQARSFRRVLSLARPRAPVGTVISAGTGAGKTLAFYGPALASAVMERSREGVRAPTIVAVYPRVELLNDQASRILKWLAALDDVRAGMALRPLRVAALSGATPARASYAVSTWGASTCPYFTCPTCDEALVWEGNDLKSSRERLRCANGHEVESNVALTRDRMRDDPPDVLLTTTEMANRLLNDTRRRHLLGVEAAGLRFLLLDEAHVHTDMAGANVALMLRRWRHLVQRSFQTVALSATLRDPQRFVADLCGLPEQAIGVVAPDASELDVGSAEHILVLRGNPASGTSLLSTSIQVAMLMRRVLDSWGSPASKGVYGRRVLAFTDDLDVTNRLFHFLRDAEGWRGVNRLEAVRPSLAVLRSPDREGAELRRVDGQVWDMPLDLGHGFLDSDRARVARTSSQDKGFDLGADIVVATASLEVGVDDDEAGAVVQHSAPRGTAAFLQRKGRAGRPPSMRPWTVVVLGDQGRDRLAFQSFDRLIDPEIDAQPLPIRNLHVLRMQAALSTVEWLVSPPAVLRGGNAYTSKNRGSAWSDLSRLWQSSASRGRARELAARAQRVLEDDGALEVLMEHLRASLQIDDATLEHVVWLPPRSLLGEFLPTLVREIEAGWEDEDDSDLPDPPFRRFIPRALFEPFSTSSCDVRFGADIASESSREDRGESPTVLEALERYAPGRVTFRLAVRHTRERRWVPVSIEDGTVQPIDVSSFVTEYDDVGVVTPSERPGHDALPECRLLTPRTIALSEPEYPVGDTSMGRPRWEVAVNSVAEGVPVTAAGTALASLLGDAQFYLHGLGSPARVGRFARVVDVSFKERLGSWTRGRAQLVNDSESVALGALQDVDALVLAPRFPESTDDFGLSHNVEQLVRLARLRFSLDANEALESLGPFDRAALADLAIAGLVELDAGTGGRTRDRVDVATFAVAVRAAAHVILGDPPAAGDAPVVNGGATLDEAEGADQAGDVAQRMLSYASDARIADEFARAISSMGGPLDGSWLPFLHEQSAATLAASVVAAAQALHSDLAPKDLSVDVVRRDGTLEAWISEDAPGGGGVIEAVYSRSAESARTLWSGAARILATAASDRDDALDEIVRLSVVEGSAVFEAFHQYRSAGSVALASASLSDLASALRDSGIAPTQRLLTAVTLRVLRPGSNVRTDRLAAWFVEERDRLCAASMFALDARQVAYVLSADVFSARIEDAFGRQIGDRRRRFDLLLSIAAPFGPAVIDAHLPLPARRGIRVATNPGVLIGFLDVVPAIVDPAAPGWWDRVEQALLDGGAVRLASTDASAVSAALLESIGRQVVRRYQRLQSVVAGAGVRTGGGAEVDIVLPEWRP